MKDYIKSETYRLLRSKSIYVLTAILTILPACLNLLLAFMNQTDSSFRYGNLSFALSNVVANPMLFVFVGSFMVTMIYDNQLSNGNLKNTLAFGISRSKIFLGQSLVVSLVAFLSMLVILAAFLASALLLLPHTGPVTVTDLLTEVPAVLTIAIAGIMSMTLLMHFFPKVSTVSFIWLSFWSFIPRILDMLGLRFKAIRDLAMWFPANFFSNRHMPVNMSQSSPIWSSSQGMIKCILVGSLAMLVFAILGNRILARKDL